MPAPVAETLSRDVLRVVATPEMQQKLASRGFEPDAKDAAAFRAYIDAEIRKWEAVVRQSGATVD
ncbi:MAG: hypothetical protein GAK38_02663 [Xylophilus sp.]|nr:MAG: hypothetical protein GAK38_02663 [Xylophilus sp.]